MTTTQVEQTVTPTVPTMELIAQALRGLHRVGAQFVTLSAVIDGGEIDVTVDHAEFTGPDVIDRVRLKVVTEPADEAEAEGPPAQPTPDAPATD